ncbi:MAG: glycerate kinase [Lactobacillales bacterium]|jgi:glycerate kinase|nr:glycerate kinase [Lactobacillales bacterium]
MEKIVIAMDSFKGSISSLEAGQAVAQGIQAQDSSAKVEVFEIADGGEGSLSAVQKGLSEKEIVTIQTVDLLSREIEVDYVLTTLHGVRTAIIESAKIIGLHLVEPTAEIVIQGTSYGVGVVLADALKRKAQQFIVFLGGSGTTDGGLGLWQALGVKLLDTAGNEFSPLGNPLLQPFSSLDFCGVLEMFHEKTLILASDVTSFYGGENGAAHIFAKQKGATPEQIIQLDKALLRVAKIVQVQTGVDLQMFQGSGAAGGLGGGLAVLGGTNQSGFEVIAQLIGLERAISTATLVYTGEGSIDRQSSFGKVPMKVAELAKKAQVPVIALAGRREETLGELEKMFAGVFSIQLQANTLKQALMPEVAKAGLCVVSAQTYKLFQQGKEPPA